MTISLDTNILVRLFINDNPSQSAAAVACLEKYEQIHLSDTALIETIYILAERYELGRSNTHQYIKTLLDHPKVTCNHDLFHKALAIYEAHPALSIEDCCIAVDAHLNQAVPLLTFDKKLAKQLPYTDLLAI